MASKDSFPAACAASALNSIDDDIPLTVDSGPDYQPSETVIAAVAIAADVDPLDLPPLAHSIDPDALDSLFASRSDDRNPGSVTLSYADFDVEVEATGLVTVSR